MPSAKSRHGNYRTNDSISLTENRREKIQNNDLKPHKNINTI